ncbi:N-acylglucosamine 2-epimerase [bacterium]|nr:N-acylglucosamine 2-epimerase [bacterium]
MPTIARATWLGLLVLVAVLVSPPPAAAQQATSPALWLDHTGDLARFWLDDRYHGDPVGSFPTFICADGRVWDPGDPCPSLAGAPDWIAGELGRQYTRMVSRQVFTYGVIYHLTGDRTALDLARAGTRHIIDEAFDPATGSVATYLEDGAPGPAPDARTTQSLAYALLGPGLVYYLTGDAEVLAFIRTVKEHIFTRYWSDEWGMLRWANPGAGEQEAGRQELVAQLDQINAYLLLMLPLLPPDERAVWEGDLRRLIEAMLRDFHDAENHRFYGWIHAPEGRQWGERHNDFGHTTKAYWMLERAGVLLGERAWVDLAREGLRDVLQDALVRRHLDEAPPWQRPVMTRAAADDGTYWLWANEPDGIGIAWWEWCELDQAAATLALTEPRWTATLTRTVPTWLATMVDPVTGAVYSFPGADGGVRAHHWQNGYHAAEHALVGYITGCVLDDEPGRLYYDAGVDADARPVYLFPEAGERISRDGPPWPTSP